MGTIRKYKQHRAWTVEETARFKRMCEKGMSPSVIAKYLDRPISSVNCKRRSLGLPSMRDSRYDLTAVDIGALCGTSQSSVFKTWIPRGLKTRKNGCLRIVTEESLFKFMEQNQDLWNAKDCDRYFFRGQPWFEEKLNAEQSGTRSKKELRIWTTYERARVKMLYEKGLSYQEIGRQMGRSTQSVYLYIHRHFMTEERSVKNGD